MPRHDCSFPEVLLGPGDEDDTLKEGMRVVLPCEVCGETPRDYMEMLESHREEAEAALLAVKPDRPLYHWTPAKNRKQIMRRGLLPHRRTTTTTEDPVPVLDRWNAICLADSPSWAWALSGDMKWTPSGEWDLWMTWLNELTEPVVLATDERPSGLYEVRTAHRIYKRHLWLVGSRTK